MTRPGAQEAQSFEAPIRRWGQPFRAAALKHLPVWAFHGAKDPVVPPEESRRMVDALRAAGGNVRLTIYKNAQHDSWTKTYANPRLYEWFLRQRRVAQPPPALRHGPKARA